jgi:hypothetical protein
MTAARKWEIAMQTPLLMDGKRRAGALSLPYLNPPSVESAAITVNTRSGKIQLHFTVDSCVANSTEILITTTLSVPR